MTHIAAALVPNIHTIGVAASGARIPGQSTASFNLNPGEIYYGIGIHGNPVIGVNLFNRQNDSHRN
ncbi:hypothetical protein TUA1478L_10020 [Lactiplantibacillus plantarum]